MTSLDLSALGPIDQGSHPPDFSALDPVASRWAGEAQGFWENAGYQVAAGAKAAADSITHIGTLAAKSLAGAESMVGGGSFGEGYEAARQQMRMDIGTTDPGAMEVVESLARKMGLASSEGPSVGRQTDDLIQRRLGTSAVVGQTVGSLLSFAAGPGAAMGKMGAQVARPLANVAGRVGRAVGKTAPLQAAGQAASTTWAAIGSTPGFRHVTGIIDRSVAAVGRSNVQLLETTAANIAQSYAMAPDDQRLQGAILAAKMSPFMVPIARAGEVLASRVAGLRLSGSQASTIREAFDAAEAGKISLPQLDAAIRANSSTAMRGLANGIAGTAEGTAFMAMDPSAWDELKKWQGGDADAGARLLGMWAGTALGVVMTKGLVTQDLAPLFRTVRPDANTLTTYIEAERNKRLAQQEPQQPQPMVQKMGEVDAPPAPDRTQLDGMWTESQARTRKAQEEWVAYDRQMRSDYGWAQTYADGPLRAGFTPTFEEGGNIRLSHGRDFSVTITKQQNPSISWDVGMGLRMDPKVGAALRDFGRPLPAYDLDPANRFVEMSGQDAVKALNDLTMLGAYRQLEGALQYQRAGFTEVEPGVWRSDDGIYHTRQLDGSTATKGEFDGDKWTATADFVFLGDFGQPAYDGPTLQALEQWVVRKNALTPDPLVDGILGHAASIARYGNGIGAQGLRQWLDATPWESIQWQLNAQGDRGVAMFLGELASGNSNAQHAAREAARRMAPSNVVPRGTTSPEQPRQAEQSGQELSGMVSDQQPRTPDAPPPEEPFGARMNRLHDDPPKEALAGSIGAGVVDKAAKATGPDAKRAYDYIFEQQSEVLAKAVPGEAFPFEARRAIADRAEIRGRSADVWTKAEKALGGLRNPEGKALRKQFVNLDGATNAQEPAWLAIADGVRQPATPTEKSVQEGFQEGNLALWNEARAAGEIRLQETDGGMEYGPLPERNRAFTQRVAGDDFPEVMAKDKLRRALFEATVNAKENSGWMVRGVDEQTGQTKMRRGTADDLEAEFQQRLQAKEFDSQDREAATEFVRRFAKVPYVLKVDGTAYSVFESDPFKVFSKLSDRQASRIAAVKQWGQDVPEPARRALLENPATPPEVRANLERGGITARLAQFRKVAAKSNDLTRLESLTTTAKQLAERIQGVEPIQRTRATQVLRPLSTYRSAALSVKGFLLDLPEPFLRNPTYVGWARSMKAIARVASNPQEAITVAQRTGAMEREIGDWVLDEAKGKWAKLTSLVGTPASFTERLKGAAATVAADMTIADAKAGKATLNDLQVAQDILRLSAEDVLAIREGRISKELETQWRNELVGLLTSRVRPAAGSAMAASPNVSAVLAFTKWFTKRTSDTVRTIASVKRAADRSGWNSRETRTAVRRMVSLVTGMTVSGTAGVALGQFFTGLMSGAPVEEGVGRFWKELSYAPELMLLKGLKSQVVGGPMSQVVRAAQNPDDANAIASVTQPSAMAMSLFKMVGALASGDAAGAGRAIAYSGFIPLRADMEALGTALLSSPAVQQAAFDARAVREWKRANDVRTPFGTRNREPQFYEAVASIVEKVRLAEGDPKKALSQAMVEIRSALALAPEESVAAAIEGHQLTKSLTNAQRADLAEWVNDTERMNRIYQHDAALRDIGSLVRKMEGVNPTEWQSELASVRQQASMGATDRWDALVQRTLDDSMGRMLADEDQGSYVDELAEAMAEFPDQLRTSLGDKASQRVSDPSLDTLTRARRIAAILRGRVRERAKSERERLRKEARNDG